MTFSKKVMDFFSQEISKAYKGEERKAFLKLLVEDPERLARQVQPHLTDWSSMACVHLREVIICNDVETGARQVVEHWKTFFAEELATVTT